MKLRKYFFILFILFVNIEIAQAVQQLKYDYSPIGNRKKCYIGHMKIASPISPEEQEEYTETLDNIQFNIYPNPTKGLLKIAINTDIKIYNLQIEIYDINGKKIVDKSLISQEVELDLTDASAGNYFMKVFVNEKPYYWNILKE